jgi:Transposase DDE domain
MCHVMEDRRLARLARMAISVCKAAQDRCPRRGPGHPQDYSDWQMAVLILIAVLNRRKSKSAQYRYLKQHANEMKRWLGLRSWPARSTYFERYLRAWRLFEAAIEIMGRRMCRTWANARTVAVDKSLVRAKGPEQHKRTGRRRERQRKPRRRERGSDPEANWGYSTHHGWIYGYSFEVVVCAPRNGPVVPLLASVNVASTSEHRSFTPKIDRLPKATRDVLADAGYDNNRYGEQIEYDGARRTGRRFICPSVPRPNDPLSDEAYAPEKHRDRCVSRERRLKRKRFFRSRLGRSLFKRRRKTVEPFIEWLKNLFDLHDRVWHRGLNNNATQILAAIFAYQILAQYNRRFATNEGEIQWLLDGL